MNLTRIAVQRPITTLMVSLLVILLGAVALSKLAIDLMPDLTYPTVSVSTLYRGAGPEEIETLLTRPMEQALSSVSGAERLSSSSMEGNSQIRVQFAWGTDLDAAIDEMRQSIQTVTTNFPNEVEEPYFRQYDIADQPILYLGLTSELPPLEVTQLAEDTIMPQLERLPGVARVRLRGHSIREIQVNLEREKLEALDMGVNDIVEALQLENVNQPAGDFDEGHIQLLIRSRGEFRDLEQIEKTVIRQLEGAVVRVEDIAQVVDGEQDRTERTRVNGEPGVMIYVFQQSGANTIEVSNAVHETVARLNGNLREAFVTIRLDKSDFIRNAIKNVQYAAVLGIGLAVLVLIVFLHSFRSTLVIAVSIPLSVLFTFVLIYYNGFTLNMVSFGGLALGIGMLVDNSIVVLENIYRRREEGMAAEEAAIVGTSDVSSAIIASTLTTLIVFVPLMFIEEGTTGVLLHQLAAVVAYSLICSLAASLTLTPVLAAYWLNDDENPEHEHGTGIIAAFHSCNRFILHQCESCYARILSFSLRRASLVGSLLLLMFSVTVGLWPFIGTEFLPNTDEGGLFVSATMAPGIQLPTLDRQASKVERAVQETVPEMTMMSTFIGDGADDADDWNECRVILSVASRSKRDRTIEDIRKKVEENIGPLAGAQVRVRARSDNGISRLLRVRGSGGNFVIEIRGHDLQASRDLAEQVKEIMESTSGLINVELDRRNERSELSAVIDRTKAGTFGIRVSDITQALETTIRGTEATVFRENGHEYNVLVRLQETDRNRFADIQQVGVTTPFGSVVPLKSLVDFQKSESDVEINRLDQQRIVSVAAEVENRPLGDVVADIQRELQSLSVPEGTTINIAGDWEEQQKAFKNLLFGFILAITMMYMVMASQFESLRDPLIILFAVPLGAIGVILVLVFTQTTLNVQSYIGIVMLAGIVVNNAIVLLDCIKQVHREEPNLSYDEVLMKAGRRRFRPIIMTALTTILAMLPLALGWGEGGELQAPMARVVLGGLLSSTLITLIAIPLLAQLLSRRKHAEPEHS